MTKSHINGRKMVTIKSHLFKKLCLCMISSTPSSSIIRYVCIIILSLTDSVVFLIQWAPLSSPIVSNHDNHHHEKTMIRSVNPQHNDHHTMLIMITKIILTMITTMLRQSITMLGRKQSLVGEHNLVTADYLEEVILISLR